MSNKQIKIKTVTSLGNVIAHLESLLASLQNGYLTIITHDKALILQPQDPIQFDMEAAGKAHKPGARQQLSVKFKWQRKPDAWKSMIRTSAKNQASDQTAEAPSCPANNVDRLKEQPPLGDVQDLDAFAELSPIEAQVKEKPQRKPQSRKPAAPRRRKPRA